MSASESILSIRAKAGNTNEVCPTCGKSPCNPFRVYVGNKIVHGCIDAIHTGRLVVPSESARWHAHGEPLRRKELAHLKTLGR
jgi:hypothetical protein